MVGEMDNRIAAAAREFYRQHDAREKFDTLAVDICPQSLDEAYQAQGALEQLYQEAHGGRAIGGYKVALTSLAMQTLCNVDQPAGASIFSDVIYENGVTLRHADYINLSVESEMAFRLKADLPDINRPHDRDSVTKAISGCMAAVEIIDDRGADYSKFGPGAPLYCCVADLGWNRGCVLGSETKNWQDLDIANLKAVMEINGEIVGEGHGRDALGHPLTSLAWVANHQITRGRPLSAGDVVMTGSVVKTRLLKPGDVMRTVFETLGEAKLIVV
jgi:2-keto-4-pentenoate hydratase